MLTKVAPKHQVMDQFAAVDGQIHVAGFTMTQISAMLDKKVFYVYSRDVIAAQVEKFRQQIPPRIKLHFAVKANPNPAVAPHPAGSVPRSCTSSSCLRDTACTARMTHCRKSA